MSSSHQFALMSLQNLGVTIIYRILQYQQLSLERAQCLTSLWLISSERRRAKIGNKHDYKELYINVVIEIYEVDIIVH